VHAAIIPQFVDEARGVRPTIWGTTALDEWEARGKFWETVEARPLTTEPACGILALEA